jgi:hypothetical protein
MSDTKTSFEAYGYRTSSRFGSRLKVSVEGGMVSVTGPRVGVAIYRLWIAIQSLFLASVLPMLIVSVVLWNWIYLVIALALFITYYIFSSVGAVALWEYQNVIAIDKGYQTASFQVSSVKRVKIGRGWARNRLWLVIVPFIVPLNKLSEGRVVSFEAMDKETGKDAVFALHMSNDEEGKILAKLLEVK